MSRISELMGAVFQPVPQEMRKNLERIWSGIPEQYRTEQQMWGWAFEGCGATIGAMPRCDFACRGCYLGDEANRIPAEPVEAIKEQMRVIRQRVGRYGNLQLTDGEVILRPVEEVIELIRYARSIDLVPMLMTHGDSFRRRGGLLDRLVVEAGLREVSIHVDTTQRGRKGSPYKDATEEKELNPLRQEFADMLADVQSRTGVRLRAATTMTVTAENVEGVPDVVRWLRDHGSKAFSLISFQPVAQVGRTEDGLGGGVSVEALWEAVAEGLVEDRTRTEDLDKGNIWHGHPACSKYVNGFVVVDEESGEDPRFLTMFNAGENTFKQKWVRRLLKRQGATAVWREQRAEDTAMKWARAIGLVLRDPLLLVWHTPLWLYDWIRDLGGVRGMWRWLRGKRSIRQLLFISHHFMSAAEIDTPEGQERVGMCVFHVPINGELRSMCEVNALGIRDQYYDDIEAGVQPGSGLSVVNKPDKDAA